MADIMKRSVKRGALITGQCFSVVLSKFMLDPRFINDNIADRCDKI